MRILSHHHGWTQAATGSWPRPGLRRGWLALIFLLISVPAGPGSGGQEQLEVSRGPVSGRFILSGPEDASAYYILQSSRDLMTFAPESMALGSPAPRWERSTDLPARFYRLRRVPRDAPLDTDGDGIDDVWELERPGLLDPLDPSDAGKDPDGDGSTHLEDYFRHHRTPRGVIDPVLFREAISSEVSVFNFGLPTATEEALSPEVSVFNFGLPSATEEALSPEISIFNAGEPAAVIEILSPEVSVLNGLPN